MKNYLKGVVTPTFAILGPPHLKNVWS